MPDMSAVIGSGFEQNNAVGQLSETRVVVILVDLGQTRGVWRIIH